MGLKHTLFTAGVVILLGIMGISGYMLWDIYSHRASAQALHNNLLAYSPMQHMAQASPASTTNHTSAPLSSPGLINAQLFVSYPSAQGWLAVPGTAVDHPFVQGADNDFYLHHDINHHRAHAGTVFMDYRNCPHFTDFNTFIYGHNMNNGSMFATLREFIAPNFFNQNTSAYIFLPHITYPVEILAFAIIAHNDPIIYRLGPTSYVERQEFLDHLANVALHHTGAQVTPHSRLVTLSTCRNDSANRRMVLVGLLPE